MVHVLAAFLCYMSKVHANAAYQKLQTIFTFFKVKIANALGLAMAA
jgi:hypothetical protein